MDALVQGGAYPPAQELAEERERRQMQEAAGLGKRALGGGAEVAKRRREGSLAPWEDALE